MDLVCLVLLIIDLFKPTLALSIVTIVLGFLELFLLLCNKRDFGFAYICSLVAIGVGVAEICVM